MTERHTMPRRRRRVLRSAVVGAAVGTLATGIALPGVAAADDDDTSSLESVTELGSEVLDMGEDMGIGAGDSLAAIGAPAPLPDSAEVTTDIFRGDREIQDIVPVLDVTGSLAPIQPCSVVKEGGGQSDSVQKFKVPLGENGPTSFQLTYETYSVPDKMAVKTPTGEQLWSTRDEPDNDSGYLSTNGEWNQEINVPPGVDEVIVEVLADKSGTKWKFTAHCP